MLPTLPPLLDLTRVARARPDQLRPPCEPCLARRLQKGTTYNSYLIFGEKTALVDASHEKFRESYLPVLQQQLQAAGRSLDYIVVSHTEPDHSGALLGPVRVTT